MVYKMYIYLCVSLSSTPKSTGINRRERNKLHHMLDHFHTTIWSLDLNKPYCSAETWCQTQFLAMLVEQDNLE